MSMISQAPPDNIWLVEKADSVLEELARAVDALRPILHPTILDRVRQAIHRLVPWQAADALRPFLPGRFARFISWPTDEYRLLNALSVAIGNALKVASWARDDTRLFSIETKDEIMEKGYARFESWRAIADIAWKARKEGMPVPVVALDADGEPLRN